MEIRKSVLYTILVLILIVIAGFFFLKSGSGSENNYTGSSESGEIKNVVLGMKNYNYYPNTINAKVGQTVRISLDNSVSGCYRSFTIRQFGVAKYLSTSKDYVEITPNKAGTYRFACSMGMGTGTLIVE